MVSLLFTIGGAVVNALAFSDTNFIFSRLTNHGAEEHKRHDLALKKLQEQEMNGVKIEWNALILWTKDYVKKNEARTITNNGDEEMLEYYRVFSKQIDLLPPEPELSDFYHPSENQKNGELLFVVVGTGITTYALYNYLK